MSSGATLGLQAPCEPSWCCRCCSSGSSFTPIAAASAELHPNLSAHPAPGACPWMPTGPPCPAPKCHYLQSNTQLMGRKKLEGHRFLGQLPTPARPAHTELRAPSRVAPQARSRGWLPAPECRQRANTATSGCTQREATSAPSTHLQISRHRPKKQALSTRILSSATDQRAWNRANQQPKKAQPKVRPRSSFSSFSFICSATDLQ